MLRIDEPSTYAAVDSTGFGARLRNMPQLCEGAWREALALQPPPEWKHVKTVVLAGMGGSAIAGDLVADLVAPERKLPIVVVRDFTVPFALSAETLVIACSHSGNTRETLSVYRQALAAGAPALAVAGGGALAAEAAAARARAFSIAVHGEPRIATPYLVIALLGILSHLGFTGAKSSVQPALAAAKDQLARLVEGVPTDENPAKQLAAELQGKLPIVYGGGSFSGLARRWKSQFNENSKAWAFFEIIPEALHNAVEAYTPAQDMAMSVMAILLEPRESGPLGEQYRVLEELLSRSEIPYRLLRAEKGPPLVQVLNMLLLGDYASYYLALLRGVDPAPIPTIDLAKQRLRSGDGTKPGR